MYEGQISFSSSANKVSSKRMGCHDNSVPTCVPVSMLLTAKLSGYLLSLLLASVFFLTGGESLSESQILLLLRAETQRQKAVRLTHKNRVKACGRWIYL